MWFIYVKKSCKFILYISFLSLLNIMSFHFKARFAAISHIYFFVFNVQDSPLSK